MKEIREVTVFSHGDSELLSTWSNVPYFFTKTLIDKGIRVNRVNINPVPFIERLYDHTFWRVMNKLRRGFFNKYIHTWFNQWEVNRRIRAAVRQYPASDAFIFLSFSHSSARYSSVPVVLFCDWTIDYYFRYFLNRPPMWIEKFPLKRQDKLIGEADLVISLFPVVTDHLKTYYQHDQIWYLGNVVNSALTVSEAEVMSLKASSRDILFIGNRKYFEGAVCLIRAFALLKPLMPDLRVHIIGMESRLFDSLPDGVTCYGYLDKSDDTQRGQYYSLLQRARVVVNTTEKWGAFSSTIEAMYFYTPVITSPYPEFVETFGETIRSGYYCEAGSVEALRDALVRMFAELAYREMCLAAHADVEPFSWGAYMDRVLEKIAAL